MLTVLDKVVIFIFIVLLVIIILFNIFSKKEQFGTKSTNSNYDKNLAFINISKQNRNLEPAYTNQDVAAKMIYPQENDIVDYEINNGIRKGITTHPTRYNSAVCEGEFDDVGNYICNKTAGYEEKEYDADLIKKLSEKQYNTCPNKSLNMLHKSGPYPVKKNSVVGQLQSDLTSPNTPENIINKNATSLRPVDFYKNVFSKIVADGDDRFKGYNYGVSDDLGSPYDVGRISLEKTNIYPVGVNFAVG